VSFSRQSLGHSAFSAVRNSPPKSGAIGNQYISIGSSALCWHNYPILIQIGQFRTKMASNDLVSISESVALQLEKRLRTIAQHWIDRDGIHRKCVSPQVPQAQSLLQAFLQQLLLIRPTAHTQAHLPELLERLLE